MFSPVDYEEEYSPASVDKNIHNLSPEEESLLPDCKRMRMLSTGLTQELNAIHFRDRSGSFMDSFESNPQQEAMDKENDLPVLEENPFCKTEHDDITGGQRSPEHFVSPVFDPSSDKSQLSLTLDFSSSTSPKGVATEIFPMCSTAKPPSTPLTSQNSSSRLCLTSGYGSYDKATSSENMGIHENSDLFKIPNSFQNQTPGNNNRRLSFLVNENHPSNVLEKNNGEPYAPRMEGTCEMEISCKDEYRNDQHLVCRSPSVIMSPMDVASVSVKLTPKPMETSHHVSTFVFQTSDWDCAIACNL
jgi:hypothetical protein